jgi:3-hydroxy acid dehydrogenase/malonic semialdehyde reductase
MTLEKHTILITGATAGFGKACAEKFANAGAKLILTGRRIERLKELQNTLDPKRVHIIQQDVRDRAAVETLIDQLPPAFQEISVLVNNAGLALGLEKSPNTKLDDWEQMIDTNIKGVLYYTHTILKGMVERNRGHIVNLGSIAGTYPYAGGNVYGATKAFLEQFSLNLRTDLLGKNIRVTNIEPGMAETEFSDVRFSGDQSRAKQVYEGVKALTAEDIAETIYWCITQPEHVNINRIEMMCTMQVPGGLTVHRK